MCYTLFYQHELSLSLLIYNQFYFNMFSHCCYFERLHCDQGNLGRNVINWLLFLCLYQQIYLALIFHLNPKCSFE